MVPQRPSFLTVPVLLALVLAAIALAVVGAITVMDHRADVERQVASEMAAIIDLKLDQVVSWRRERISDANFVVNNPQIHRNIQLLITDAPPAGARREMLEWMKSMYRNGQYGRIVAFNKAGKVLASVPDSSAGPGPYASGLLERAAGERTMLFSDLAVHDGKRAVLDVIIPIFAGPRPSDTWIGSVVLSIDPYRVLFPILHTWPIPSGSGQLSLVRREGAEIVFLGA